MKRAMPDTCSARRVHRFGQLTDDAEHGVEGSGGVMPHRRVERFRGDVLFGAIRDRAFDASRDRLDDRRMNQLGFGGVSQLVGERLCLFRGDVETKDLDRDETIARGLVGTEHRSQRAHANLMQDPEGSKCRRGCECRRIVSGQLRDSSAGSKKCNTVAVSCQYTDALTPRGIRRAAGRVQSRQSVLTCFRRL